MASDRLLAAAAKAEKKKEEEQIKNEYLYFVQQQSNNNYRLAEAAFKAASVDINKAGGAAALREQMRNAQGLNTVGGVAALRDAARKTLGYDSSTIDGHKINYDFESAAKKFGVEKSINAVNDVIDKEVARITAPTRAAQQAYQKYLPGQTVPRFTKSTDYKNLIDEYDKRIAEYKNKGTVDNTLIGRLLNGIAGGGMSDIMPKGISDYLTAAGYKNDESEIKSLQELERERAAFANEQKSLQIAETLHKINQNNDQYLFEQLYDAQTKKSNDTYTQAVGYTDPTAETQLKINELIQQLKNKGYTDQDIRLYDSYRDNQNSEDLYQQVRGLVDRHPVLGTAAATGVNVLTSPVRGVTGILDKIGGNAGYGPGQILTDLNKNTQTEVYKHIDEKYDGAKAKALKFAYNVAVSSAESALGRFAAGGVSVYLMGLNAASSTYDEALARGLDKSDAVATAVTAGIFETLFEHIAWEKIDMLSSDGLKKVPAMIKDLLVSAGTEGSEEVLTDLSNELWDYLTNGGLSEYEVARASGMSAAEYAKQFGLDLLESFAAGAASGGLSYAVMSGKNYTTNKAITAARNVATGNVITQKGDVTGLIEEAEKIAEPEVTEKVEKLKEKTEAKPKTKVGQLINKVTTDYAAGQVYNSTRTALVLDAANKRIDEIGSLTKSEKEKLKTAFKKHITNEEIDKSDADILLKKYTLEGKKKTTFISEYNNDELPWVKELNDKIAVNTAAVLRGSDAAREVENDINIRKRNVLEESKKENGRELVGGFEADYNNGTAAVIGAIKGKTENGIEVYVDDNGGESGAQVTAEYSVDNAENKISVTDDEVRTLYQYAEDQIHNRIADENLDTFGTAYKLDTGVEMSVPAANVELALYDPNVNKNVDAYCMWFYDAYKAGTSGISFYNYLNTYMDKNGNRAYEGEISREQLNEAFKQGARNVDYKKGLTRLGVKKLNNEEKSMLAALHEEFKSRGLSLVVVDSLDYMNSNGYKVEKKDVVVVALDADQGLFTTAAYHELFHVLEAKDKKAAKELTDTIIDLLKTKMGDERYNEIYQQRLDVYNGNEKIVESEIAAQYIGTLASADIDTVAKEMQKQPGLWQKIVDTFKDIIESIKSKLQVLAIQDKTVRAALDTEIADAEKVLKMFGDALDKALQPYDEQTEVAGISVETNSAAPVINSLKTWTESDYVREREKTKKLLMEKLDLSARTVNKYLKDIDSIAKMIADDRMRLDYDAAPGRSAFVSNSEYGGSIDFNTLCAKRRLLTGTFTAIQNYFKDTALTADEILELRNMMKKKKYEVNCGLCYVEGSRAKMGVYAQEFIKRYKKHFPDASYIPNMAEINTPDGIEQVRIEHPEVYEQYEKFWNNKGKIGEGDTNLFSSQAKPKLYQSRTDYKHEIIKMFDNADKVDQKNLNGGIRIQSFSDFELVHMLDMMQVIMDMSRVGLGGQAYTKVPEFAWAFGGTGLKINLSLIAKGVDENGKLIFDDVEGMPHNTAFDIRNEYSDNVGTILVVFDDAQLYAAMADDRVDFIIPFHRSQWKKSQYNDLGLPSTTKDFTYVQNERYTTPHYHEFQGRQIKEKAANYMPNTYWDFSKSGKQNAEKYLEMCFEDGRRPKFYKLLDRGVDGRYHLKADGSTDGYWKLLIDFKMYNNDGKGVPQMPVKPSFNMGNSKNELLNEHSITNMLDEYTGGHSSYPVAQDIVDEFIKKKEGKIRESRKITEQQNEDISYSKKIDTETDNTVEDLLAENESLRQMNEGLNDWVKDLQHTVYKQRLTVTGTKGLVPNKAALMQIAKKYNSRRSPYTNEQFVDIVQGIFLNAVNSGRGRENEVISSLYKLVDDVITNTDIVHNDMREEYSELRSTFKNTIVTVIPEVYNFLLEEYSGKKGLADAIRGKMKIKVRGTVTDKESVSLNTLYAEQSSYYPEILDPEADEYHQVQEVLAAFEAMKPVVITEKEELGLSNDPIAYDKYVLYNATQIFEELAKATPVVTAIDRLEKEIAKGKEKLKAEQKKFGELYKLTGGEKGFNELKEYYKQKIKDTREYEQSKYEREQKIKNITRTVRRINAKLESNSKNKRIVDEMKPLIAPFVRVFVEEKQNGDELVGNATFSQKEVERLYKFYAELQRGIFARQINRDNDTDVAVSNPYERFYTEQVLENLHDLQNTLAGKTIRSLDVEELRKVNEIVDNFSKMITESEEIFVNGKKVKIVDSAKRFAKEAAKFKGMKIEGPIMKAIYRQYTPIYFFKELLGEEMGKYYDDMRDAQDDWVKKIDTAITRFDEIKKEYHYDQWKDDEIKHTFSTGFTHNFSIETILQIYATAKRESMVQEDTQHLFKGGIVFNEEFLAEKKKREKAKKKKKGEVEETVNDELDETTWLDNITAGEVKEILAGLAVPMSLGDYQSLIAELNKEQKDYADKIVEFMSTEVGAWGNKATSELYGIDIFNEKYYFPFKVDDSYRNSGSVMSGDPSILARGFTKRLTHKANPPLLLSSFTEVAANHVQEMAQYSAFAIPVSNMQSLYFASIPRYEADENGDPDPIGVPVKGVMKAAYGEGAAKYMHKFLQDLNGGIKQDDAEKTYQKWLGRFKRSAVLGNMQVVIQQPTSIMRAMAVIPPQYFLGKATPKDYKEMMKYSEIAKLKQWGGFDIGFSGSATSWIINEQSTIDKIADGLGKGAEYADAVTWTNLWNASKRYIKKHTDLEVGSEEYFNAVKKFFRDICDYTQVYDSTLTRNEYMRSKSGVMKTLTAFGAEPSISFNLLMSSGKNKKINKPRAIVAFVANVIFNEMFKAVTSSIRKRDNERNYFENYLATFLGNVVGSRKLMFFDNAFNPLTLVVFAKDVMSVVQGFAVERPDMSVINDIYTNVTKFADKGIENAKLEDWLQLAGTLSEVGPIPINSIVRDGLGFYNLLFTKNDAKLTKETLVNSIRAELFYNEDLFEVGATYRKVDNSGTKEFRQKTYDATSQRNEVYAAYKSVLNNQTEVIRRYRNVSEEAVKEYIAKGYSKEDAIAHAQRDADNRYHSKVQKGLILFDEDVAEAAWAKNEGNLQRYEELVNRAKNKGFTNNDVMSAVNSIYKGLQPTELQELSEETEKPLYDNEQLKKAFNDDNVTNFKRVEDYLLENGKTQTAINSTVSEMIWNKFDEGQISLSDVRKEFKTYTDLDDDKIDDRLKTKIMNMYKDGKITADKAADYLVKYANEESDNARNALDFYEWQSKDNNAEKYPDVTKSNYNSYIKYDYESIGVDFSSYLDIREKYNSFHGETKQADIAAYINTLPYSRSVKEQLFLKMGGYSPKALQKYSFK